MASVSCASEDSEPRLMAPVVKRLTISATGSTSDTEIGLAVGAQAHQAAQQVERRVLLVHAAGEVLVGLAAAAAGHRLQAGDRARIPHVLLAVAAPLVLAALGQQLLGGGRQQRVLHVVGQRLAVGVGPRARVAVQRLAGQAVEADAADPRRRAGEVAVDHAAVQADGLEHLRPVVGADGRDAHLGDDLQQRLAHRGDDLLARALGALEHQVRVHGGGAVADQRGDVVRVTRLARLHDQAHARARARAHQVVVHGGQRQQRGHRGAVVADGAVAQDQDADAVGDGLVGLGEQALERGLQALLALVDRPGEVQRLRHQRAALDRADAVQRLVLDHRVLEDQAAGLLGRLLEQVALGADHGAQAHHDLLAHRVDGRVGHLREQLLEVGEQRRLALGDGGQGHVVAHRAHGLGAAGHRGQHRAHVLLRPAEGQLALLARVRGTLLRARRRAGRRCPASARRTRRRRGARRPRPARPGGPPAGRRARGPRPAGGRAAAARRARRPRWARGRRRPRRPARTSRRG